jgi:hypothetical protein
MRINEIHDGLHSFTASIRVRCGATPITVRTSLEADSQSQARALLCHLYGAANVLSVTRTITENRIKVLSADDQRIKSMSDQSKRLAKQAKYEKALKTARNASAQLSQINANDDIS